MQLSDFINLIIHGVPSSDKEYDWKMNCILKEKVIVAKERADIFIIKIRQGRQ